MKGMFCWLSSVLLVFAAEANAEVLITSRSSLVTTSIDFGFIGSVLTTIDSKVSTAIDDSQLKIEGSATDGGPIGDVTWDASYQYLLDQQLVPNSPHGFSGSGGAGLFAFAAGDGVCYLTATNRMEVEFENSQPTVFNLIFNPTDASRLVLDRMTSPGVWDYVWTVPGGLGEISTTLPLEAGVFRLSAETIVATDNGFANGGSWAFSITAVPEPTSMGLLAIGAFWLMLGRRPTALGLGRRFG